MWKETPHRLFDPNEFRSLSREIYTKAFKKFRDRPQIKQHVEGVPGSGKTRQLVSDYINLRGKKHILTTLAFNNKVPFLIRRRIAQEMNKTEGYVDYDELKKSIRTFDAIFYQLAVKKSQREGIHLKIMPLTSFLRRVEKENGTKERGMVLSPNDEREFVYYLKAVDLLEVFRTHELYLENLLRLQNKYEVLTFEFLPYYIFDEVEKMGFTLPGIDEVLIDEHQDLSPIHTLLLAGSELYTYGDSNQMMYEFFAVDKLGTNVFLKNAKDKIYLKKSNRLPLKSVQFVNRLFPKEKMILPGEGMREGAVYLIPGKPLHHIKSIINIFEAIVKRQISSDSILLATMRNEDLLMLQKTLYELGYMVLPHDLVKDVPMEWIAKAITQPKVLQLKYVKGAMAFLDEDVKRMYITSSLQDGVMKYKSTLEIRGGMGGYNNYLKAIGNKLISHLKKDFREKEVMFAGKKYPLPWLLRMFVDKFYEGKAAVVKMGTIFQLKGEEAKNVIFVPVLPEESKFIPNITYQNAMYVGFTRTYDKLYVYNWSEKYRVLLKQRAPLLGLNHVKEST